MIRRYYKLIVVMLVAFSLPANADVQKKDTIKSLEDQVYQVRPGRLVANSKNEARSNYRAFLDLLSDDPLLRAEAMRRLADLELEATEATEAAPDPAAKD